jgi:hypothetical protein
MTRWFLSSCALTFALCFPAQGFDLTPQMFFSQSTRRDADTLEKQQVVHVGRGCTAYFVENKTGKKILGSARHCFGLAATAWCTGGGTFKDNDGKVGKCTKVLAADTTHDLVFFEADFDYVPKQPYRLSAKPPQLDVRLKMVGYPCDKYRSCKLTVTENCWVLKTGVPSPHPAAMSDKSALHNCTTYGGNSGGPMVIEGTDTIVGLPFTYQPNDYKERSPTEIKTASHMALMADFVAVHREALDQAGVVIVE